jgi:hypothetical protein
VVIDEREQIALAPVDGRAVQRVTGPPVVARGGLEPPEHPRGAAVGVPVQAGAGEVALDRSR